MKLILASLALVIAGLLFSACESDLPPKPRTEPPFVRGLTGGGTTVPYDRENDPMIHESGNAIH